MNLAISVVALDPARILCSEFDLSSFGFFQRGSVQEFMVFFSKTLAERTPAGTRQSVKEQNYVGHTYTKGEGISVVILTDEEYPTRVAFTLIQKLIEDFIATYPKSTWNNAISYPSLKEYLVKYQNPKEADPMMKIQKDLDETKIILHQTIESVLERGQKLDNLIERSEDLSMQSKTFYKTAKKTNSCCSIQ